MAKYRLSSKLLDYYKQLTWRCRICNAERPDDKISVFTKDLCEVAPDLKFEPGIGAYNIKYCNDNEACIEGAKNFKLKDGLRTGD